MKLVCILLLILSPFTASASKEKLTQAPQHIDVSSLRVHHNTVVDEKTKPHLLFINRSSGEVAIAFENHHFILSKSGLTGFFSKGSSAGNFVIKISSSTKKEVELYIPLSSENSRPVVIDIAEKDGKLLAQINSQ